MELVQRYVAAVQRELPEAKREEIGRELQANIMDQLDALAEQNGALTQDDIASVLKQMGHPRTVAQQFVPLQPLISLGYMRLYKHTLFMVLGILFLLQIVESTSAWLSSIQMGLISYLHSLISGFMHDSLLGFTSITLAFMLMSRLEPTQQSQCEQEWQPTQLPKVSASWQHIDLQDVFTDLASYVFLLIVIWHPFWLSDQQLSDSRFLLTDTARLFLQWASPLAVLGIINSLWQLRQRFWNQQMLVCNILLNGAFVIAILLLAVSGPLFRLEPQAWQGVFDLHQIERASISSLVIVALFPLWEVVRDVWRLRK
jgi:hypothetical protein